MAKKKSPNPKTRAAEKATAVRELVRLLGGCAILSRDVNQVTKKKIADMVKALKD